MAHTCGSGPAIISAKKSNPKGAYFAETCAGSLAIASPCAYSGCARPARQAHCFRSSSCTPTRNLSGQCSRTVQGLLPVSDTLNRSVSAGFPGSHISNVNKNVGEAFHRQHHDVITGVFLEELFPARLRYSGISVGYQMAGLLGGGFAPIIATALIQWSGGAS